MFPGVIGCAVRPNEGSTVHGKVSAVFDKAVHLKTADVYITLGSSALPSHPFTIAVPRYLGNIGVGLGFTLTRQDLRFLNGCVIPFTEMEIFTPWADRAVTATKTAIREALAATRIWSAKQPFLGGFHEMLGGNPPVENPWERILADAGRMAVDRVVGALRVKSWPCLSRAVDQLAGFGQGLTPSGDDWLGGFLASLRYFGENVGEAPGTDQLIDLARAAGARTSPYSAFLILCSARGLVSEPVAAWLTAACKGAVAETIVAAKAVADFGHSSGIDCLGGLVAGLETALE